MPHKPRLNRLIQLLEEGKPAFGAHVYNGNLDEIAHATTAGYDFVFVENEHVGMDFTQLKVSLQFSSIAKASTNRTACRPTPRPSCASPRTPRR